MIKKILILFILFLFFVGFFGLYSALKYRQSLKYEKAPAKATEIRVTFLEGWTKEEIAEYLGKKGITTSTEFLLAVKNFNPLEYQRFLPKEAAGNLEGFLFPDTYFIPQTAPSSTTISGIIIKKALDNFGKRVTPEMLSQSGKKDNDLYKIITLASIIEKETGRDTATAEEKQQLDDERKIIAGIFYNRLNAGVALQSDATVNFATKKNLPSPTTADTEVGSPYNTYKYKGLPPGPISNPSLSSIMAALYPETTSYFYFLHDQTTGQVFYAKTYEEHLKNKQKYLK